MEELTELDTAIILTIYTRGNRSKKAHFPIEFICKGFPSHLHGRIKKRVEKLRRVGYVSLKLQLLHHHRIPTNLIRSHRVRNALVGSLLK
jgi:hypothetical protein